MSLQWDDFALEQLMNDPHGPVGRDLEERAIRGEAAAKRLLSQHGTGRIYAKSRPRRVHQASAPGEPPAVDLGHLRASVGHEVGHDEDGLYAEWGTGLAIGTYLELGTRHIEPRPFIRPSLPAAAGDSEI